MPYRPIKHLPSIRKIPDELWDEIKIILPPEKANKTIGRPVISFRKVLDGILYILRTGYEMEDATKKSIVMVQHAIGDFNNGQYLKYFSKIVGKTTGSL